MSSMNDFKGVDLATEQRSIWHSIFSLNLSHYSAEFIMTSPSVLSKKKMFLASPNDEDSSPETEQHFMMHRLIIALCKFKNTISDIENDFSAIMDIDT